VAVDAHRLFVRLVWPQTIRIHKIESDAMVRHAQDKWRVEFEKRKKLHNLVGGLEMMPG